MALCGKINDDGCGFWKIILIHSLGLGCDAERSSRNWRTMNMWHCSGRMYSSCQPSALRVAGRPAAGRQCVRVGVGRVMVRYPLPKTHKTIDFM